MQSSGNTHRPPTTKMATTETSEAKTPPAQPHPDRMRILVVDDEPDVEFLMKRKFRQRIKTGEFEMFFAPNGVEALRVLAQDPDIDILLSDINMPEMDGLNLLMQVAVLGLPVKAIIMSAYGDMSNIRSAMNKGAFDFVTKPVDFNDLELTLTKTIGEVKRIRALRESESRLTRLENELNLARAIQQSILPTSFALPTHPEIELHARMEPAAMVGGDFYDFFFLDKEHLALVIADVSGKGIPAAFFMAISRTLIRSTATRGASPMDCMSTVNKALAIDNPKQMFVTAFYGVLNVVTGEFRYCNAGHNPPLVRTGGASWSFLPDTGGGLVLGLMEDAEYAQATAQLSPGDMILLYTDGVTESMNPAHELFGEKRLAQMLGLNLAQDPALVIGNLFTELSAYAEGAPPRDDITSLAVQWRGNTA